MKKGKIELFLTIFLSLLLTLVMVWGIALQFLPDKHTVWNYLFNSGYALLYYFGALTGIFGGIHLGSKTSMGKALLYIGLGLFSYATGLVIWTYYNIVLAVEIPSPSIADIFFLVLFLPVTTFGFWNLLAIFASSITRQRILEGVAVFLVSLIVVFGFANKPAVSIDFPLLNNLTNAAYPLVDSILLSLAIITLRVGEGKIRTGIWILVIGFLFQVGTDFMYTYTVARDIYWNGNIADVLYGVSAFVISLGLIRLFYDFRSPASPA